jgi:hypothetical protein
MNNRVKKMFVAIYDNEVIVFDTNFSSFYSKFKGIEPGINSQSYYSKLFQTESKLVIRGYGKEYIWQKLV